MEMSLVLIVGLTMGMALMVAVEFFADRSVRKIAKRHNLQLHLIALDANRKGFFSK